MSAYTPQTPHFHCTHLFICHISLYTVVYDVLAFRRKHDMKHRERQSSDEFDRELRNHGGPKIFRIRVLCHVSVPAMAAVFLWRNPSEH